MSLNKIIRRNEDRQPVKGYGLEISLMGFFILVTLVMVASNALPVQQVQPTVVLNTSNATNFVVYDDISDNRTQLNFLVNFSGNENKTIWLNLPKRMQIINASLNLSGEFNISNSRFNFSVPQVTGDNVLKFNATYVIVFDSTDKQIRFYNHTGSNLLNLTISNLVAPSGLSLNDTHYFILNSVGSAINFYDASATAAGSMNTGSGAVLAGITSNSTYFWTIEKSGTNNRPLRRNLMTDGTFQASFNPGSDGICPTSSACNDIDYAENKLWILSAEFNTVYRYTIDGSSDNFTMVLTNDSTETPLGLDLNGTAMYVYTTGKKVYRYNMSLPAGIGLDAGNNGQYEWQANRIFNETNNRSYNLSTAISDFLSTCTAKSDETCDIPIILHSEQAGALRINNINITYRYNISQAYSVSSSVIEPITEGNITNTTELNATANNTLPVNYTFTLQVGIESVVTACGYNSTLGAVGINNCTGMQINQSVGRWSNISSFHNMSVINLQDFNNCPSGYTDEGNWCSRQVVQSTSTDNFWVGFYNVSTGYFNGSSFRIRIPFSQLSSWTSRSVNATGINMTNTSNITYVDDTVASMLNITYGNTSQGTLASGIYRVSLNWTFPAGQSGGGSSPGGGGGGGGLIGTQCGNSICEIGEDSLSCPRDCGDIKFNTIPSDSIRISVIPGSTANCFGDERYCSITVLNPTANPMTIRVSIEPVKDGSYKWGYFIFGKDQSSKTLSVSIPAGSVNNPGKESFFVTANIPEDAEDGEYQFNILFELAGNKKALPFIMFIGGFDIVSFIASLFITELDIFGFKVVSGMLMILLAIVLGAMVYLGIWNRIARFGRGRK